MKSTASEPRLSYIILLKDNRWERKENVYTAIGID